MTYRGILQNLAETDADSNERFQARRLLPGMAKRLREVIHTSGQHASGLQKLHVHNCSLDITDGETCC